MKDHFLRAAAVNSEYCKRLIGDIPDELMAEQPFPGMNHAAWVLGHLTFVADSMIRVFDLPHEMPKEWNELFNVSSKPLADRARYPSKDALVAAYDKAYARITETVKNASAESLDREFPNPKLRSQLPTVGVAMVHVLTSHHALHLGQLSAWRRAIGLPPA